ncbi:MULTISPECIES: bifunctional diguanylate cyclase/phosphodiesterase [unclassified Oceanobacter]|uniref:putative bifunctional diguanylate cyclase/phosphodiesterase n=1 Tax=unclassified Oceanobacter TaxID=2620260 RepID=UPI002734EE3B|nr:MULTISPECIES: EAL domain-containing protein [unclassified Oceanobacter]MDP2505626.1 EAL domain-containing protein [Oceanobacter sp. 3_MG-2023]MDP2547208.1 EAL domain-containing protein [Oceanobacter sp. 4_MG-2023]
MHLQVQRLKHKLVIVTLLTTTLTLIFSSIAFTWLEYYLTRQDNERQLNTIGTMIARHSAHELLAGHTSELKESIRSLSDNSDILSGCIYDANNLLVITYLRDNQPSLAPCPPQRDMSHDNHKQQIFPIQYQHKTVGTLTLHTTQESRNKRLQQFGLFSILIAILALLLGFVASSHLKELVLRPLHELYATLKRIAQDQDYSIRATRKTDDELGALVDLFNSLLQTIETEHASLKENEARFRKLAAFSPVGIFQVDTQQTLQYVNQRWREIHQLYDELPQLERWFDSIAPADLVSLRDAWQQLITTQEGIAMDLRLLNRDSSQTWIHLMASPMNSSDGEVVGYLGAISDISELKYAQLQMENLAFYDSLTGLANRRLFKNRLTKSIKSAQRTQSTLALVYLDMDQFKRINDSMGHDAGDQLLQEAAKRLSNCVRDRDTVSRIGGDEFTILLTDIKQTSDVLAVAEKLLSTLNRPVRIKGQDITTSVSIGITLTPQDSSDPNTLMKNADLAMYRAKELGRNNIQFFSEDMNRSILEHLDWEQKINTALAEDQFNLVYQPKISLQGYHTTGLEALVRWHHPKNGLIPPSQFIPVAEENGQMLAIGRWILERSCTDMQSLLQTRALPADARLSVNLSASQFAAPDLQQNVQQALQLSGLAAANLELEITESTLMRDVESSIAIINNLQALGIRFAIDDFGTGYSSLSHLKRLPITVLKIDPSFVADITTDVNNMAITAAIIAMAHKLGLSVVAEGVESDDQVNFLRNSLCDEGQGYLFSRPLTLPQLQLFLHKAPIAPLNQ